MIEVKDVGFKHMSSFINLIYANTFRISNRHVMLTISVHYDNYMGNRHGQWTDL